MGHTLSSLAFKLNVSFSLVSQVLYAPQKSTTVRRTIADALGYHPWLEFALIDGWSSDGTQRQTAVQKLEAPGSTPSYP